MEQGSTNDQESVRRLILKNVGNSAPELADIQARNTLGSIVFTGDVVGNQKGYFLEEKIWSFLSSTVGYGCKCIAAGQSKQ